MPAASDPVFSNRRQRRRIATDLTPTGHQSDAPNTRDSRHWNGTRNRSGQYVGSVIPISLNLHLELPRARNNPSRTKIKRLSLARPTGRRRTTVYPSKINALCGPLKTTCTTSTYLGQGRQAARFVHIADCASILLFAGPWESVKAPEDAERFIHHDCGRPRSAEQDGLRG